MNIIAKSLLAATLMHAVFAVGEGSSSTTLNANNDHQFWFEQFFSKKLPCDWSMVLSTKQRWGADYRILFYHEYEGVFQYDIKKFFHLHSKSIFENITIGPGNNLNQIFRRNTLSKYQWLWVERPILEANVVMQIQEGKIRHRVRAEYLWHLRSHHRDFARFRYRVRIDSPWKWTRYKINPYVSNEWFFRNHTFSSSNPRGLVGGYYENRFRAGVRTTLFEKTSTEFFWQWRADKQRPRSSPRWNNIYIIGIVINIG